MSAYSVQTMARCFTAFLILMLCQWASANVIFLPDQATPELRVEGKITEQDLKALQVAVAHLRRTGKKLHMDAVQLNSSGGRGEIGREMGRLIRRAKLNTFVAPESRCSSACMAVLIGGVVRMAFGTITVHRTSLLKNDLTDDQLKVLLPEVDEKFTAYIKQMGISSLLAESVLNTPNWASHELTDTEKLRWGVHGMERVFEEVIFRKHARELKIKADEFADLYAEHFKECDHVASRFEATIHQCVLQKGRTAKAD